MKLKKSFMGRFIKWLIDGITFTLTVLLILSAYSYTRSYINRIQPGGEEEAKVIENIRMVAPKLAQYLESEERAAVLLFVDFGCPSCEKFWESARAYFPVLSNRYRFVTIPESVNVPIPVANIFIDRYGMLKKILKLDSTPSAAIIDLSSYSVETLDVPHSITNWLQRESALSRIQSTEEHGNKGGNGMDQSS